ncbi:MAG: PAS domain S-box protein [bacterium]|nr:PAS domain S-box protein [bacterium]
MIRTRSLAAGCALIGFALVLLATRLTNPSLSILAATLGGASMAAGLLALLQRRISGQRIAASAARGDAVIETATEGIVTTSATGTIETFNAAAEKMFGWDAGEAIGQNVRILMPNPFRDEHDGYLRRYRETGERRIIGIGREVVGRHRDGSTFPIALSVGEGEVDGQTFFTAILSDLSERNEMQRKLTQAERLAAVGELAAGVAHEVNNPINTMINCAQLIQDGDDPELNSRDIIEEGQRIAEIVRDLLQFARDDQDTPQETSLQEVVQRTLRLVGENLKRHGIRLRVEVPDDLPQVLARPQQIQQVLLNLIMNAKDAVQPQSEPREVTLRADATKDEAQMSVSDNGPGLPEGLGDRIFEPFVTTKRARGGTGLGLSISKSIIEGYGGRLEVETAPNVGTTFRFFLPRVKETGGG